MLSELPSKALLWGTARKARLAKVTHSNSRKAQAREYV